MEASRRIVWAALALSAGLTAVSILDRPAVAGAAYAAKSDKLVPTPAKGDLLNRKPDRRQQVGPAATDPWSASRGPAARRLIDVALRDEGMWLNSFATRSMPLDALACAELSEDIVAGLQPLPGNAVQRLAEDDLMRQTRVCGVNGSLLVTCYGGAATVSLRPPKPGDGCGG